MAHPKRQHGRRHDDQRPGSGFRLSLNGRTYFLMPRERDGAAQIAQIHQALGASSEEIATAVEDWLKEQRRATRWFSRSQD
jgi:hypothetical protein